MSSYMIIIRPLLQYVYTKAIFRQESEGHVAIFKFPLQKDTKPIPMVKANTLQQRAVGEAV